MVNIDFEGLDQVSRRMKNVIRDLRGLAPFWSSDEMTRLLSRQFTEVFVTEGYGEWPPLAASTLEEKREANLLASSRHVRGVPEEILVRSRALITSVSRLEGITYSDDHLTIESPIEYAEQHERGNRKLPRRRIFGIVAERIGRDLELLMTRYIEEEVFDEFSDLVGEIPF